MSKVSAIFSVPEPTYRAGPGHSTVVGAPAGYSVLAIDEDAPDSPVWEEPVLGFIIRPEHEGEYGHARVHRMPVPVTALGSPSYYGRNYDCYLNCALKTPAGKVWLDNGDERKFNSQDEWEQELRQYLRSEARTTKAAAHA